MRLGIEGCLPRKWICFLLRLRRLRPSVTLDQRTAVRADQDVVVHFLPAIIAFLHGIIPPVHVFFILA